MQEPISYDNRGSGIYILSHHLTVEENGFKFNRIHFHYFGMHTLSTRRVE